MFRRRRAAAVGGFTYKLENQTTVVSLNDGTNISPVSSWSTLRPAAVCAVAEIEAAAADARHALDGTPLVEIGASSVRLHPEFVASLDAVSASAIGLPPATALALDLKPIGRIDQDDFYIQLRWVRPGGQPARVALEGPFLKTEDGVRRIPQPLWALYTAALSLAQPLEKAVRFERLSHLKDVWPGDPQVPVASSTYLQDLRVHYASSLSLKLRELTPDSTDFDPILFGARAVNEAHDSNREPDEELDSVLAPSSQKLFAESRFKRDASAKPVYVLRDGEYVFIDPALRPALDAVRQLQNAPEKDRREFVLNPRRVLRERMGAEAAEHIDLDRVFIETEQFSARVAGVDVWRQPVLPWLVPSVKNQWLPERFGLRVGEDYFVLPSENVSAVVEKVQTAAAEGRPTADVTGLLESASPEGAPPPKLLPVNEQTLQAVKSLEAFGQISPADADEASDSTKDGWDAAVNGKLFLVVRDNFEEVEYTPLGSDLSDIDAQFETATLPSRVKTPLKPHQIDGFAWLADSAQKNQPGVLLADDMGLGKTIQAISFMAWLQDQAKAGARAPSPFLIVAPTGLLGTWKKEIVKHLDETGPGNLVPAFGADLKALKEEDSFNVRDIETGRASLNNEDWREAGIVLTTYETMRDYHFSFARTRFGLIVFDEIQKLKNPTSQVTRAAKSLNSDFILGMTGTPVENRLQDLWSIMDVIIPGMLGSSRDFERRYSPTDKDALTSLKRDLTERKANRPAHMLRRLKIDALKDMPVKHVHKYELTMPPVQANTYRDLVIRAAAAASAGTLAKGGMLSTLAAMRGVSLHPTDPRTSPSDIEAYARDSARLSQVLAILKDVATKSEKALIFVEDLAMQERLAGLLQSHFKLDTLPLRINGSVSGQKRQEIVDAFELNRNKFDVMILSPKAGGVGLTITSANHVIHLSRWWNPAVEDQATDRVFRIGQTRDVHVYLPMAAHPDPDIRPSSFDLRLDALIDRKRSLTRDLFLPPEPNDKELGDFFREVSLGSETEAAQQVDAGSLVPPITSVPEMPELGEKPTSVSQAQECFQREASNDQVSTEQDQRPILSLPKGEVFSGIRHWRRSPGQPRPTPDIVRLFEGKKIVLVAIRDPYALAHNRSREAQVQFLKNLSSACQSLDAVTIEYAPDIDGDLEDGALRRSFTTEFLGAFQKNTPRLALNRRPRRVRGDDFHDRFVELDVRSGNGTIQRHEITIGRGVEALYNSRLQCTVTYAPPGTDSA